MADTILDISAVVKDYRGLRPLRMERLVLSAGDHLALLGMDEPSAEMMSTLVTGAAVPDSGTVRVLGTATTEITTSDTWLQLVDRIGLVTDRAALLDMLTVAQNLALSFTLSLEALPADVLHRVTRLSADVGLDGSTLHHPVRDLDGGGRTRVRLGRAVALEPTLLVLEHPTAQVEREGVTRLAADMKALFAQRQLTVLILTADAVFADAVGARVMDWDPAKGILRDRRQGWASWWRQR